MTEKNSSSFSAICRMLLKTGIAGAVIWWLYRRNASGFDAAIAGFNCIFLIPAILITVFSTIIASCRWQDLAKLINIDLPRSKAFSLTMQGVFFSLVIPGGAIGGDVIKMAAMTGHLKNGCRTEGIFSIIADRIVGMISLFLTAVILLLGNRKLFAALKFPEFPNAPAGMLLWWLLLGVCAAGSAAGILVFLHRKLEKIPGVKAILAFLDRKSHGKVVRILNAVDTYSENKGKITFWVTVTAFAIHLTPALSLASLLYGAGVPVNWLIILPATVIGNIAGLLPLFPGGIGARDVVTVALLCVGGIPQASAAAAMIMSTLILICFNLTGAVFFIADRKRPETEK